MMIMNKETQKNLNNPSSLNCDADLIDLGDD